ncbi:MAG: Histidine ammonia-lyase [Myxococcaceae bacterium]|nr:Histidine ammonia-lyase [Myxococcaceae bacterium]
MSELVVGERALRIEDVVAVAAGQCSVRLSDEPGFVSRIDRGAAVIERRVADSIPTYGVNTGFGASVKNTVAMEQALTLAANLPRYHGCGVGPLLSEEESRAVTLVRLTTLAAGYSGVRLSLLEQLAALLRAGVVAAIPSRGSVGASGDLTPLSYIAALLMGERKAWLSGQLVDAADALAHAGLEPLQLQPKESLAIMNGTSIMAGLSCLAFARAENIAKTAALLTAAVIEAMGAQRAHFDARLFQAKPHPGQAACASWIRDALGIGDIPEPRKGRIQERYSLRCAPHVIGVLVDALSFSRSVLEIEINGASDNPLVDPDAGDVLHGGNFYGGHVAMVADTLKTQVANVADLLDRQLVLLNDPQQNGGLPENLNAVTGDERFAHHGFKAMEITASALTAEALKLTMPASVFSRSTEGHNQDKVSMGSIAAQDFQQITWLTENVLAVHLIACAQAVDLRGVERVSPRVALFHQRVREHIAPTLRDRPMDGDIIKACELVRTGAV